MSALVSRTTISFSGGGSGWFDEVDPEFATDLCACCLETLICESKIPNRRLSVTYCQTHHLLHVYPVECTEHRVGMVRNTIDGASTPFRVATCPWETAQKLAAAMNLQEALYPDGRPKQPERCAVCNLLRFQGWGE